MKLAEPKLWTQLGRAMRLTCILLTAAFLHAAAGGLAQRVTIRAKAASLPDVFRQIEQQTSYSFFYKTGLLATGKPVTLDLKEVPIETALVSCFSNQPFTYSIQGRIIAVMPKPDNKNSTTTDVQTPGTPYHPLVTIAGTVLSTDGRPLANASVKVRGTANGTTTDANGRFSINTGEGDVLIISFVGFVEMSIRVSSHGAALVMTANQQTRSTSLTTGPDGLIVKLSPADSRLDEVQIIAYGTSSKRFATGDASTIKSEDIEKQPVTNLLAALQGRSAGVLVTSANGIPGSGISMQIRGNTSISALSNPLYIVDGTPFTATTISVVTTASGQVSPFNSINPQDIESVTILKDAEATAIYGSRGANGVVLITTKKGKPGKTKLDLNAYSGASVATRVPEFMNTQEYLSIRKKAFAADNITPTNSNAQDLLLWNQNNYTNFPKLIMGNTAPFTNVQASLSGGNENTRFLMGMGYHHEGAVIFGDNHDNRVDGHINVDHNSDDKRFNINASVIYASDNIKTLAADPFASLIAPPNYPHYDSTGNLYWVPGDASIPMTNPWSYMNKVGKNVTDNFMANTSIRYAVIDGLFAKVNLGYTKMFLAQQVVAPTTAFNPTSTSSTKNTATFGNSSLQTYIVEPQLDYTRKIGKGVLNVLAGGTAQSNASKTNSITGINFTSDDLIESISAAATITGKTLTSTQYKYISGFSRLNFRWMDKYLFNATFRRDGSSRFGPRNRFGNFWSLSGGWIFSEENVVKNLAPFLSFGKLRGSLGITGNDQIGDYKYYDTYTSNALAYNGNLGLYGYNIANPDIAWEQNRKLEVALELGFLHDRILLTSTYYRNRSSNELIQTTLPAQTGFDYYQGNLPALVQNTSWEFELSSTNINHKNFRWQTTFNITFPKNELLSFPGLATSAYANSYFIGQSLKLFRGYNFTGISMANGTPQFTDVNKDGFINSSFDYGTIGSFYPEYYGGMGNTFSYKNFSLDIFLQFSKQNGYGAQRAYLYPLGYKANLPAYFAQNYWEPTHTMADRPGVTTSASLPIGSLYVNQYYASSAAWDDASYMRLKTLSFAYTLPKALVNKMKAQNLRIYIQGQNLFTLTSYKVLDPEVQTGTPVLKTLTAGIQLTF